MSFDQRRRSEGKPLLKRVSREFTNGIVQTLLLGLG